MNSDEFSMPNWTQGRYSFGQITPEKKVMMSRSTTPNSKHGAFAKVHIDQTPLNHLYENIMAAQKFNYLQTPQETPRVLFKEFGPLICKPLLESEYFRSSHRTQQISTSALRHQIILDFSEEETIEKDQKVIQRRGKLEMSNKIEEQNSSSEYVGAFGSSHQSSKSKRTHEKGLKNLSQMVLDIVNELGLTTYKDVTDRLIQLLIQQGVSSKNTKDQTNVKRRAYDILNVLVSSGELQKVGKQIGPNTKPNQPQQTNINELKRLIQLKKKAIQLKHNNLVSLKTHYIQKSKDGIKQDHSALQIIEFIDSIEESNNS